MPLVFAAITPHPPFLIPNIGKDKIEHLEETKKALEKLEQELYIAKPQLIIIISPHSSLYENAFSANASIDLVSSYEDFGDLSTKKEWHGEPNFAAQLSQVCKDRDINLQLVSQDKLDHGASVPLFYLTTHLKDTKVLPIGYTNQSAEDHIKFGEAIKEVVAEGNTRVAIIASGDLSHDIKDDEEKNLDTKIVALLKAKKTKGMVKLGSSELMKSTEECGYRSIMILLGLIKDMDYDFKPLAYEHPFGVGYLTGSFEL